MAERTGMGQGAPTGPRSISAVSPHLRSSHGAFFALGAAAFFGLLNVAARASDLHPLVLSASASLVAAAALSPFLRRGAFPRKDLPRLAGMVLAGGVAAPTILFFGLEQATAVDASFLLTTEMAFTALLAAIFLRERLRGARITGFLLLAGAALLVAGAAAGKAPDAARSGSSLVGGLLVVASAFCWAVDNTVSASLSARHPPERLIALKTLLGGLITVELLLFAGAPLRLPASEVPTVLFLGLAGLAGSTLLFYHALRRIGATATVAMFLPTGALTGAVAGHLVLGEPVGWPHGLAAVFVIAGVLAMTRERSPAPHEGPLG
ncbi:MAG: DMT family transporter [Methanobacteriota archaeon]